MGQSCSSSSSSIENSSSPNWSDFNSSGPKQLTRINWENRAHRRVVASTLISALYVSLDDLETRREATTARAPRWWSFFGFELAERLIDSKDPSPTTPCFGAVFERSTDSTSGPVIVFAIRGAHTTRDLDITIQALFSILETRTCFAVLMQALERYTQDERLRGRIWLCGHSLGAALATGAGQAMAKKGISLTTFLFNPPYYLDPTTKNLFFVSLGKAMRGMSKATSLAGPVGLVAAATFFAVYHSVKALVGHIEKETEAKGLYEKMTSWVPFIYVNRADVLSRKYIEYFENRSKKDPPHLPKRIASAVLVCNMDTTRASTFPESHGIMQWGNENLDVQAKACRVGDAPSTLDTWRY